VRNANSCACDLNYDEVTAARACGKDATQDTVVILPAAPTEAAAGAGGCVLYFYRFSRERAVGKPLVTVVPVGRRFAILILDPAEQVEYATSRRDDPHDYAEAEPPGILTNCYKLSPEEIGGRIPTVRGRTPIVKFEVAMPQNRAPASIIGRKSTVND
jgi:hypothetical protein